MMDYSELTFKIFWSDESGEWVAACDEAPSMSWLALDPVEALAGLLAAMNN